MDERRVTKRRAAKVAYDHGARTPVVTQSTLEWNALERCVVLGQSAVAADDQGILDRVDDHERSRVGSIERPRRVGNPRVELVQVEDAEHLVGHFVKAPHAIAHRHAGSIRRKTP